MSLRCRLGLHNYRWAVTNTEPPLNWRQCQHCGKIDEEYRDQYEAYQELKA